MKESGVSTSTATIIYDGVHMGGKPAWISNKLDRESQRPRVIPLEYLRLPDNVTWGEYRQFLISKGVRDPVFPTNPPYCELGNTINVP